MRIETKTRIQTKGPTPPAPHDDDTPVDPDLVLITRYLALDLSAGEMLTVSERYEVDAAFRAKADPVIHLWQMPLSLDADLLPGFTDAARNREPDWPTLEAEYGRGFLIPPQPEYRFPPPELSPSVALSPFPAPSPPPLSWIRRTLLAILTLPELIPMKTRVIVAAVLATVWAAAATLKANDRIIADSNAGRAPLGESFHSLSIVYDSIDPINLVLGPGAVARLLPGPLTRIGWRGPMLFGFFPPDHAYAVSLDGTAIFKVMPGDSIELKTYAGALELVEGIYAVSCDPGCDAVRIRVGLGHAKVHSNFAPVLDTLSAFDGQLMEATTHKMPKIDTDSTGFPSLKEMKNLPTPH